ncbi:SDR family oxidoreductase [Candidatus Pelagibacter sp.]|nr:SDR family oxidoreductase [Candidatus Pelagibacter sp.]
MLNLNLENEFINKKIIVTGASRGLGAETCKALALRGAKIAMFSRSKIKMDKLRKLMKNPSSHISVKVDLLKSSSLKVAVQRAKKFLKEIDIVIHVAGGGYGLKNSLIKSSDLKTLFQINLGAAVEINNLFVKNKRKNKSLKLIHVGSIASNEAVGSVGYNIVKSALAAYVRSLGRELYSNKVLVTGILPGGFIAEDNAMDRLKKKNKNIYKNFIKNRLPRGVMGKVDEIIPMLLFLCSKHSEMMGGCLIPMDAGEGRAYQI